MGGEDARQARRVRLPVMLGRLIVLAAAVGVFVVVFVVLWLVFNAPRWYRELNAEDKAQERSRLERTLSDYSTPNAVLDAMAAPVLGGRPHAAPPLVELHDVDELDPDLVP